MRTQKMNVEFILLGSILAKKIMIPIYYAIKKIFFKKL